MIPSSGFEGGQSIPTPGLLILTGPSHSGKSSVAKEVLAATQAPAAYLSVDDMLGRVLLRPPGDRWEQIPLAYELVTKELSLLLDRGWFVIAESTFTYVPPSGEPEFHGSVLSEWIRAASSRGAPCLVAQVLANLETILSRAERTGRLDPQIVAGTVELHTAVKLPGGAEAIDTDALDATEAAQQILNRLAGSSVSP